MSGKQKELLEKLLGDQEEKEESRAFQSPRSRRRSFFGRGDSRPLNLEKIKTAEEFIQFVKNQDVRIGFIEIIQFISQPRFHGKIPEIISVVTQIFAHKKISSDEALMILESAFNVLGEEARNPQTNKDILQKSFENLVKKAEFSFQNFEELSEKIAQENHKDLREKRFVYANLAKQFILNKMAQSSPDQAGAAEDVHLGISDSQLLQIFSAPFSSDAKLDLSLKMKVLRDCSSVLGYEKTSHLLLKISPDEVARIEAFRSSVDVIDLTFEENENFLTSFFRNLSNRQEFFSLLADIKFEFSFITVLSIVAVKEFEEFKNLALMNEKFDKNNLLAHSLRDYALPKDDKTLNLIEKLGVSNRDVFCCLMAFKFIEKERSLEESAKGAAVNFSASFNEDFSKKLWQEYQDLAQNVEFSDCEKGLIFSLQKSEMQLAGRQRSSSSGVRERARGRFGSRASDDLFEEGEEVSVSDIPCDDAVLGDGTPPRAISPRNLERDEKRPLGQSLGQKGGHGSEA